MSRMNRGRKTITPNKCVLAQNRPLRIGISSCLLGHKVRYDGNHKLDGYIAGSLSRYFEFVPVCPEVAIGLGVPRPPIRLVGKSDSPRAVGVDDPALDVTEKLSAYARRMARELDDISGYILKSMSPSCGMERVKVYPSAGGRPRSGSGVYAKTFIEARPLLPVEEEGRLNDPEIRENFIERVFAYHRWQELMATGATTAKLIDFHTIHKLSLMAHGKVQYQRLGRFVADAGKRGPKKLVNEYIELFMQAMKHRTTRKRHANVLIHLMGYLKKHLDRADKLELLESIDTFRRGWAPLIVPLTLIKHHFRRYPEPYIMRQTYINPHPHELILRTWI